MDSRYILLETYEVETKKNWNCLKGSVVAFDHLPDSYDNDLDFAKIWSKCMAHVNCGEFHIVNG